MRSEKIEEDPKGEASGKRIESDPGAAKEPIMGFVFNAGQTGLRKFVKPHEEHALRCIWDHGRGGVSFAEICEYTNSRLGGDRVPELVLNDFLEEMVQNGVIGYREKDERSKPESVYSPILDEGALKKRYIETLIRRLMAEFPEASKAAIRELGVR